MYTAEHKNISSKKKDKTQKQETNEHICLAWLKGFFEPVRNPSAFGNLTKLTPIARSMKYSTQSVRSEWEEAERITQSRNTLEVIEAACKQKDSLGKCNDRWIVRV